MRRLFFITHGDVVIDADVPVPDWPLSTRGRARHGRAAGLPAYAGGSAVYASAERKAQDAAEIHAQALGLSVQTEPELHENDRSATGYLPKDQFEAMADAFFAQPDQSVRGWERAVDAQARIVRAVTRIAQADRTGGDIAVLAHGGVGTLLLCHALGAAIDRRHDQPGGAGGNVIVLSLPGLALLHSWQDMEALGL